MDGGVSKRPRNLDTGNPCRYDGFSTHVTTPDGICNPVRNVLYLPVCRGFAQNLSGGVTNPAALRSRAATPCRQVCRHGDADLQLRFEIVQWAEGVLEASSRNLSLSLSDKPASPEQLLLSLAASNNGWASHVNSAARAIFLRAK